MSLHAGNAAAGEDICDLSATALRVKLLRRELSARELVTACLERIDASNAAVNAIVTLTADAALAAADQADARLRAPETAPLLTGLPVAHKDLALTRGVRTTFGSPLFADFVPDQDALIVERLKAAGAVSIGKTNTPEFGAGSHTFNPVFGATRNPYALDKSSGGSSGGAAAALATGMVPLADGSDMGGSLRNPAAFCNVVGLRPSPGRVPSWPTDLAWFTYAVEGPMARTVEDTALMLAAIAGPDDRSPLSISEPGAIFLDPLMRDFSGVEIAFSADFGGLMPIDRSIVETLGAAAPVFESMGCRVEAALPDFTDADEIFRTGRAWAYQQKCGELLDSHPEAIKATLKWNIECGRRLSGDDLARAAAARTALYHRVRAFMQRYEFLVLPVTQAVPFPVDEEYPKAVDGTPMETYLDWMASCYYVTVTGHPAISVPAGFSDEGLPVGLQIVGRYRAERSVLQLAYAFQQATRYCDLRPPRPGERRHPAGLR